MESYLGEIYLGINQIRMQDDKTHPFMTFSKENMNSAASMTQKYGMYDLIYLNPFIFTDTDYTTDRIASYHVNDEKAWKEILLVIIVGYSQLLKTDGLLIIETHELIDPFLRDLESSYISHHFLGQGAITRFVGGDPYTRDITPLRYYGTDEALSSRVKIMDAFHKRELCSYLSPEMTPEGNPVLSFSLTSFPTPAGLTQSFFTPLK